MDSTLRDSVLHAYPQTIVTTFHSMGSSPLFNKYKGDSVVNSFPNVEFSAFPDGRGHAVYYTHFLDTVQKIYLEEPETPVAIEIYSKTWDPVNRMINLTLTMRNDGPDLIGTYWYNVIVTEDNITESHYTWPGCSTPTTHYGPDRDSLYINDWVARKLVYNSEGRYLAGPPWQYQQEITHSDTFGIKQAWIAENCNIIVNVFKKADSLYKSHVMQAIKEPVIGSSAISDANPSEMDLIRILPNPVTDITNIHISISHDGICLLNIFDLNGKKIKSLLNRNINKGLYNVEFQSKDIPSGTYLVVLETSKGMTSEKLVIL